MNRFELKVFDNRTNENQPWWRGTQIITDGSVTSKDDIRVTHGWRSFSTQTINGENVGITKVTPDRFTEMVVVSGAGYDFTSNHEKKIVISSFSYIVIIPGTDEHNRIRIINNVTPVAREYVNRELRRYYQHFPRTSYTYKPIDHVPSNYVDKPKFDSFGQYVESISHISDVEEHIDDIPVISVNSAKPVTQARFRW